MKSTCVKILLAFVLLVGFACGSAYAQVDFTIWNNSLWKIKFAAKGVVFSDLGDIPSGKARGTEQSWAVMSSNAAGDNMSLTIYARDPDTGDCEDPEEIPLALQYGGPLGFVATITTDVPAPDFTEIRGLIYFTGKLKDAALKTAKITTLGGYVLQQDWDDPTDRAAYGFTLSGSFLKTPKGCLPGAP